jgi:hypothetical protein
MAALTAPQAFTENTGGFGTPKVKGSTTILKGAMVGIRTDGFARPFATGDFFAGHAIETVDNSAGADGDKRVQVRRGVYYADVPVFGSATVANIGDPVWAVTDNHADLTLSDPGTTKTATDLVGHVSDVDFGGGVIIRFATRLN